ncbi:GntR family transcriptional regulator [Ruminococcaceae bacterium OttesenSCG-928-A16]|nr:GntR family transcriptional regulator [Ruminococcaceae bacterium OttesenSCG-928-A16]
MSQPVSRVYRYVRVYTALKEQILGNQYPEGTLLPSEHMIGEIYEVDRTTVRKALQLLVDDGLIEKQAGKGSVVLGSAAPQNKPFALLEGSIAFVLPKSHHNGDRITQPFYASLFYTIEQQCSENNYSLVYLTLNSEDDFERIIQTSNYAGIVFVSNVMPEIMDAAIQKNIPCVLVNNYYKNIVSVGADNFDGTYKATRLLIEQGHRNIGVVKGIADYQSTIDRMNGCVVALQEEGLTLRKENILQAEWDYESGSNAVAKMLNSGQKLPTALLAFNDHLALGAIHAISEHGLSTPGDISVVGVDNIEQSQYVSPPLTTVNINPSLIGKVATSNLFAQIKGAETHPVKILTPVSLVVRDSVATLSV